MPLISMTGFGRGAAAAGGIKVEVELGAVNRKQFDVRVNLPRSLFALEAQVNALIHGAILRGSVGVVVKVGLTGAARRKGIGVDAGAAAAYVRALRQTAGQLGLRDDLTAASLLRMPEVLQYQDIGESASCVWAPLEKALRAALRGLLHMKRREGATLAKDIARRLARLTKTLDAVRLLAPQVAGRYAAALTARLKNAGIGMDVNEPQLVREIALFADRCDISEEIVRLDSHFKQAAQLLHAKEPVGRTLDFLCQEMFREINTIGSKGNDAAIARHVVQFKTELEAIREQVQNVE